LPGGWELGGLDRLGARESGAVLAVAGAPAGHAAGAALPLEPLVAWECGFPAMGRGPAGYGEGCRLCCPTAG
jgi:hypothetical protein